MEQVRDLAWTQIGIFREEESLTAALDSLTRLLAPSGENEVTRSGVEARNMAVVAKLVALAALRRTESRGAHFRRDYPALDDEGFKVSYADRVDGSMKRQARLGGN